MRRRQVAQSVGHVMLDHMSSTGVMHGDGRRRGEERVKHERKENVTAVHARYRNTELSHEQKLQWRESAKDLMDVTIDKWTYPAVPLTTIEVICDSAKVAARLAKIWALAQSDPT